MNPAQQEAADAHYSEKPLPILLGLLADYSLRLLNSHEFMRDTPGPVPKEILSGGLTAVEALIEPIREKIQSRP